MHKFVCICGLMFCGTAMAACPVADSVARQETLAKAIPIYTNCALHDKDDASQLYLGQIYENGQEDVSPNVQRALLFYHLSAENGNATAMVNMAQLLSRLDDNEATRPEIMAYAKKIRTELASDSRQYFKGDILHPYALLALAAEKPESKWFYTSAVKSDPRAAQLLQAYPITPEKKAEAISQATAWKQRYLFGVARSVLSVEEHNGLYEILYPSQGTPDAFERTKALNIVKERLRERK